MTGNEKNPAADDPEATVPDKQVYRWKDDGGALPPEPDLDSAEDDQDA